MQRVPSRGMSLVFCNRLLWLFQGHLKPPEGKGISWVQWKFLQMGQRVVPLKARKQVHTMSFLSGRRVSIGSQTRAAPLLINSVSRSTISCSLTPSCISPLCRSTLLRLNHCLQKGRVLKEKARARPCIPHLSQTSFSARKKPNKHFTLPWKDKCNSGLRKVCALQPGFTFVLLILSRKLVLF